MSKSDLTVINDVKAYVKESSRAENTGKIDALLTHVTKDCPCLKSIKSIPQDWSNNGYTKTSSNYVRIISFGTPRFSTASLVKVRTAVKVAPEDVFNQAGRKVNQYPGEMIGQDLTLRRAPTGWKVSHVADFTL